MTKNEYYVNIKNRCHFIKNDTLITKTNCIKLKSMIRKNVMSLKNIKNNLYSVKKDTDSLSIDLKKLKEEHINKSNKRVKVRSILINIKVNRFNKRFNRFNKRFNRFINKASSKINASTIKDSAIVKNHVDASTSTDDLIVKNHVDACTSTNYLIVENHVDACTSTDDLIVKNHVDACTVTDTLNNNKPCDNDNEASDNEASDNKEKSSVQKLIDQVNMIVEASKAFLNNINKIRTLTNDLQDELFSDDPWLKLFEMNKINALVDESLDYIWNMIYGKKREKNEITNIDIDKDKDIDGYISKYIDIINDKSLLVSKLGEILDSIVIELQNVVGTDNYDILLKKMKRNMLKLIKGDTIKKYNDKPSTIFNSIEKIFKCFICEKFMNEKYYVKVDEDKIVFYLINKPIKDVKMKHIIEISRDMIILGIEKETKTMNELNTIFVFRKSN